MSPHYDFHLLNLLSDKYVQILYPFFTVLTIFLWLSLGSSLYILPTVFCLFFKSKKTSNIFQVFYARLWLLFSLSSQCLLKKEAFNFCEVQFAIYFMIHILCVLAKKSMPNSGSRVFFYTFNCFRFNIWVESIFNCLLIILLE